MESAQRNTPTRCRLVPKWLSTIAVDLIFQWNLSYA